MTRLEKQEKLPYVTHQTKYLKFIIVRFKPKTMVVAVVNVNSGDELGRIEWYSQWRQYCFMPYGMTVWNTNCLQDIQNFITALMVSRKPKPKTIGVISRDILDFQNWSRIKKHKIFVRKSNRIYVVGTTTYVGLTTLNHCHGYSFDKIIATDLAKNNKHYHQIIKYSKINLKP